MKSKLVELQWEGKTNLSNEDIKDSLLWHINPKYLKNLVVKTIKNNTGDIYGR